MDSESINNALKRQIQSGNEYDKYFEDASCQSVFLGDGDTSFTLTVMRDWSKKYAYQTKEIAQLLKGRDIIETANNIHSFLYNHFQYNIDNAEQNLKSPACAWETRSIGMDCKSYSIFASTVLLNLGIKHYFRKIKQPNLNPSSWTHVYVVIPTRQNQNGLGDYTVIDATITPNIEVKRTKKQDLFMSKLRHFGLNSALPEQTPSCGCDAHKHTQIQPENGVFEMGLGAANPNTEQGVLEVAVSRFHTFLDDLESKGVPKEDSEYAIKNLERYVNEGVEPTIADLFSMAEVNGLGIVPILAPVAAGGIKTGLVKAAALITKLIPKDLFSKTFGSVFANGFNLSCWNSTFTPAKVTEEVSKIHVPFFETAIASVSNTSSTEELETHLNFLLKAVDVSYVMYAKYLVNGANWKSCSKEAIGIYESIVTGAKVQTDMLLKQLQESHSITISNHTVPAEYTYPETYTGSPDFKWSEKQHGQADYRQVKFNSRIEDFITDDLMVMNLDGVIGAVSKYVDDTGGLVYLNNIGEVVKTTSNTTQTAGIGLLEGVLGLTIIAGIAYAANKKKKEK